MAPWKIAIRHSNVLADFKSHFKTEQQMKWQYRSWHRGIEQLQVSPDLFAVSPPANSLLVLPHYFQKVIDHSPTIAAICCHLKVDKNGLNKSIM